SRSDLRMRTQGFPPVARRPRRGQTADWAQSAPGRPGHQNLPRVRIWTSLERSAPPIACSWIGASRSLAMAYSTTVTALDLSGGVPAVRVSAGYTWTEVGGPSSVERVQEQVSQDISSLDFQRTAGTVFGYAGDLAPQPSPAWFIALWVQEIPRIANGTGWLFRSGQMTPEPPALPLEMVLAPEQLICAAELSSA